MARYAAAVVRWRWPIVLVATALTVWLATFIPSVRFDTSTRGSVPPDDEALAFYEEVIDTFGNDVVSVAVVVGDGPAGVFEPSTLRKIEALTDSIESFRGVQEVISLTNAAYLLGSDGFLETLPVVEAIPESEAEVAELRRSVLANELFHKTLVAADGSAAAINVFVRDLPDDQLLELDIDGRVTRLLEDFAGPEELHYGGMSYTRRIVSDTMRRDIIRLAPFALGVISIILLLSFRSIPGVALPLLNVVMAVIWTLGVIGLSGRSISLVSSMLPPLLVAVGSAYSIHVVSDFRQCLRRTRNNREAVRAALEEIGGPVFITAATTMAGFGSLTINRIPNIQTMGIFAAFGIFASCVIALTVVPALLSFGAARPPAERTSHGMDRFLASVCDFTDRRRRLVIACSILLCIVAVLGLLQVEANTDFLAFFRPDAPIRVTADLIAEKLAGASTFYLIVDGGEADAMKRPDVLHAVDDIQRHIETLPGIDKTASIVDHLKQLNRAMHDDDPAMEIIPDDQGIIEEEILLFTISHDPGAMSRYVDGEFGQMSIFVRSDLVGSTAIQETIDRIHEYAAERLPAGVEARATGTIIVLTHSIEAITTGQRNSIVLALGIVFVLMLTIFRSFKAGLLALIPNGIPILVLFGVMGWLGVTLNIGTSIIAAMVLGIAVDDTIHYMVRFNRATRAGATQPVATRESLTEVGRPIIFTTLTLCLGFLVMTASDFSVINAVGLLTGIALVAALVADLIILPAVLFALPPVMGKPKPPA